MYDPIGLGAAIAHNVLGHFERSLVDGERTDPESMVELDAILGKVQSERSISISPVSAFCSSVSVSAPFREVPSFHRRGS